MLGSLEEKVVDEEKFFFDKVADVYFLDPDGRKRMEELPMSGMTPEQFVMTLDDSAFVFVTYEVKSEHYHDAEGKPQTRRIAKYNESPRYWIDAQKEEALGIIKDRKGYKLEGWSAKDDDVFLSTR